MNKEDFDFDSEDDSYRKCEICEIRYFNKFGSSCEICDIWICDNCWEEHKSEFHKEIKP